MIKYRETPEDRALTDSFRTYNGHRIDIRWSGGWLTPNGDYYPVDYKHGITHETIADEHGERITGSGSVMTRPPIMRLFDLAGWMRITYLERSSFCVELKGTFEHVFEGQKQNRKQALLQFVSDFQDFDSYYLNDTRHNGFAQFVAAIRQNEVEPARGKE